MDSTDSERVSRAVTTLVGAGNTIGFCDSKMARDNALFSGPLLAGRWDELAGMLVVGALLGFKTSSFWVSGLA